MAAMLAESPFPPDFPCLPTLPPTTPPTTGPRPRRRGSVLAAKVIQPTQPINKCRDLMGGELSSGRLAELLHKAVTSPPPTPALSELPLQRGDMPERAIGWGALLVEVLLSSGAGPFDSCRVCIIGEVHCLRPTQDERGPMMILTIGGIIVTVGGGDPLMVGLEPGKSHDHEVGARRERSLERWRSEARAQGSSLSTPPQPPSLGRAFLSDSLSGASPISNLVGGERRIVQLLYPNIKIHLWAPEGDGPSPPLRCCVAHNRSPCFITLPTTR